MNSPAGKPSPEFFATVRSILQQARRKAAASINFIMVEAYWQIGQRIVLEEQGGSAKAGYGSELITELSKRLGEEFGRGFSVANLKNFRQFYLTFPEGPKGYALRSELGWTYHRLIARVKAQPSRLAKLEAILS